MLFNNERISKELRKLDIAYTFAKGRITRKKKLKVNCFHPIRKENLREKA